MKIKFLKQHIDFKTGEEADLPEDLCKYLIRCGVVEQVAEQAPAYLNDLPKKKPRKQ